MKQEIVDEIKAVFKLMYGHEPRLFYSPGRVNLVGEHTDYNLGYALPAAIDKAIYAGIAKRDDNKIRIHSIEFDDAVSTELHHLRPDEKVWPNYVLGVVDQLNKRNYKLTGFDLVFCGDIPIGAGMASSAAVECATVYALNEIFELGISKLHMAMIAQKAEHEFAGVMCGIMDQFASIFGKENHGIQLDCRSLEYTYVPLSLQGHKILLLNSNVKHSLYNTEYNNRRIECGEGVMLVKNQKPEVQSLRDVNISMLDQFVKPVNPVIYKRCKYVVEENMRLLNAVECLRTGDIKGLGKEMFASHDGLKNDYEVSCPELDFLVDFVRNFPGVIGARMMGAGFGGCTINIVREDAIDDLINKILPAYQQAMQLPLNYYLAHIGGGSREIK